MKIGFIGCGNMGGALATAAKGEVILYDKSKDVALALAEKIGATVVSSAKALASSASIIFLGVKPGIIGAVTEDIAPVIKDLYEKPLVVSMAAGVSVSSVEAGLPNGTPIIRIMPNTPAAVGEGMVLYTKNACVSDKMLEDFLSAMEPAGRFDPIDEKLIDAASAVSGCGPAFVYMFIEALADGGVRCGLPRDKALLYAEATVRGAATLALETKKNPEVLKDEVCSPGGTTIEGVMALENGAMRGTVMSAVKAAYEKTLKMGK